MDAIADAHGLQVFTVLVGDRGRKDSSIVAALDHETAFRVRQVSRPSDDRVVLDVINMADHAGTDVRKA